jgi:hypothetical protein
MIVVKLKGGLGNQMFQYALAKSLFLGTGQEIFFDANFSHYNNETKRHYTLDCFKLDQRIRRIKSSAMPWVFRDPANDFFKKIWIRLRLHNLFTKDWQYFLEQDHGYHTEIKKFLGLVYLDGYWQSEKYFSNYCQDILKDFTLVKTSEKFDKVANDIKNNKSVSIHVRRSDYLTNPSAEAVHPVCSLDYYAKAIELIKSKISHPKFFVFSDDPDWVRNNLPLERGEFVMVSGNNLRDCEELILMSKCLHQIIANSSFSWWGAWLNQQADKIVIAPNQWLRYDPQPLDLIPETWLKL